MKAAHLGERTAWRQPLRYAVDFTALPDGWMPRHWSGANASVAGGRLVITPTLSGELLTDPGLEGNYTAGLCDALGVNSAPAVAQSADVHGGAKAQQWTADVQWASIYHNKAGPTVGQWYKGVTWFKRSAGASGKVRVLFQHADSTKTYPSSQWSRLITEAAYTRFQRSGIARSAVSALQLAYVQISAAPFDTIIFDDDSIKSIALASTMPVVDLRWSANCSVSASWEISEGLCAGIVAKLDSFSAPANFLLAVHDGDFAFSLLKCVGGGYTELISAQTPYSIGAAIEIRITGTTVRAFYNDRQVGTDQVVSDAGIIGNRLFAPFSSDASNKCLAVSIGPCQPDDKLPVTWRPASDRRTGQELSYTRAKMLSGDTLRLDGGTYRPTLAVVYSSIPSGTPDRHTRIFGGGSILTGPYAFLQLSGQSYIDIQDLVIRDATPYGMQFNACSYVTVTGCTVDRPTGGAAFQDAIQVVSSQHIDFIDCVAGPCLSTVATCDGFEFQTSTSECSCVGCVAHGFQNGAGENDGHGFEVYNGGPGTECTNVTFTDCEAYDTRIGFSNESTGAGGDNPGVVCDYCNNHDNTFHDYQGYLNAWLTVRHHIGDCSTTGNVIVES